MVFTVLIACIIIGLPIVLSIVAISKTGRLNTEITRLKSRVAQLERAPTALEELQKPIEVPSLPKAAARAGSETATAKPRAAALKTPPPSKVQAPKAAPKPAPNLPRTPAAPKKSLEELIGTQWSVWVGGFALLVGAVFLLRYSIEAGVFTPTMRIVMAGALGLVLLGAGEWLHRGDVKSSLKGKAAEVMTGITERAYIPTLLTGIGVFTLFGTAYTAYALYGFIAAPVAFIALGVISLGSLALSLRHGPVLAAIGLVGAVVVPLLVQTHVPNIYALYGYLIVISAAALCVAHLRDWGWLNIATLGGALFWSMMSFEATGASPEKFIWFAFISLGLIVSTGIAERAKNALLTTDLKTITHGPQVAAIWTGLASLLVFAATFVTRDDPVGLVLPLGFAALIMLGAWVTKGQNIYSLIGAALAFLVLITTSNSLLSPLNVVILGSAYFMALNVFSSVRIYRRHPVKETAFPAIWAIAATAGPLVYLAAVLARTPFAGSEIAAIGFGLWAAIFAAMAIMLRDGPPSAKRPARIYVIGAALAYLSAVLVGLHGTMEALGVVAGIAIAAAAAWHFKAVTPRAVAVAFALFSAGYAFLWAIPHGNVGETLFFNSLWLYYALPGLICAGAAWVLSQHKTDIWSEGLKGLTLTFAALFAVFQIHHFMNGGNVLANRFGFDELSLQVVTGLCFTLGATRLAPHKWDAKGDLHTRILPTLAMAVSSITLLIFVLGVCLGKSPLFNSGELVRGNLALNSLMLGYLLPAVLLGFIARALTGRRPQNYIRVLGGLALISMILCVTGLIRFGYSGAQVSIFENVPQGGELYAISAAWLLLGIGLLIAGLKRDALGLRVASAILITLTVLKTFLVDMAGLEGVLRALSFVVLGVVLIVIGRIYQKILFSKSKVESEVL